MGLVLELRGNATFEFLDSKLVVRNFGFDLANLGKRSSIKFLITVELPPIVVLATASLTLGFLTIWVIREEASFSLLTSIKERVSTEVIIVAENLFEPLKLLWTVHVFISA